ncbi:VOC family protein [Roseibium sp.]|uniref:VOC family protein n=1 Tax=Roseibium sp. TaxID=1936156 RepID=UPI003A981571
MVRGMDHIVVAVRDLAATASAWEALGFTVTPENRHPWGTMNRIVQLDGFFIELLTVGDESAIVEPGEGEFSFGAFNRDFLKVREGASMLVLESTDPEADRAAFSSLGLDLYKPFSFERVATFKDGTTGKVAFDLTFLSSDLLPGLGFFTCRNRYPQTFWNKTFQTHENGASNVDRVYIVDKDPSDHHEFLGGFTGQREMRATSLGLEIETSRGTISVLNPDAYAYVAGGEAAAAAGETLPQIAAIEIGCKGLDERKTIVSPELGGVTLILSPVA